MDRGLTDDSLRVLVVDDHDLSRQYATVALQEHLRNVRHAASGEEALRVARNWQPDVIVLDQKLPDLDGMEVARRVRAGASSENRRCPRMIMLSAAPPACGMRTADSVPVDVFLAKPASPGTLLRAVLATEHPGRSPLSTAGLQALCRDELRARLLDLDACLDRLDFTAASDLVHQLIATSALGQEHRTERALRRLERAFGIGSLSAIAAAYFEVLIAADFH